MNKTLKYTLGTLALGAILLVCMIVSTAIIWGTNSEIASAENQTNSTESNFVVSDYETVYAQFNFTTLSDTECAVRIANKTEATIAIIPRYGYINGKQLIVTEISANGFFSCTKLVRVNIPKTVKKIGNMAFANCPELLRISLGNIEEIGNSAFYRCPKLESIVIPESVQTVGSYIFRNNDTQVKLRAEAVPEGWTSTWNTSNANQNIEFSSTYYEPLELEPIYDTLSRSSSSSLIGYALAAGQPRTDSFYTITYENAEDFESGENIFIPAQYEGVDILVIEEYAFESNNFEQLIIDYSEKEIILGSYAFAYAEGKSVTINRPISYYNGDKSESIFLAAEIQSVILPDSIAGITDGMFFDCANLTNIYFMEPEYLENQSEMLKLIENQEGEAGVIFLPDNETFDTIGENAFAYAYGIRELHIYDCVKNVGAYIIDGWIDSDSVDESSVQKVYIHNREKLPEYDYDTKEGWNSEWKGVGKNEFLNVEYDREFHVVTFDPGDGEAEWLIGDVVFNEPIIFPEATKPNNKIDYWLDKDKNIKYYIGSTYMSHDDATLIAYWSPKEYYVILNPENGENSVEITATYGEVMPDGVSAPKLLHYNFIGYYDCAQADANENAVQYYDGNMNSVTNWYRDEDYINLYAWYEKELYTITYMVNGQDVTALVDNNPKTYGYGDSFVIANTFLPNNYVVWQTNSINAESLGNLTIAGQVTDFYTTINYDLAGGQNNMLNPTQVKYGVGAAIYAATRPGDNFLYWELDGKKVTDSAHFTQTQVTLRAVWSANEMIVGFKDVINVAGYTQTALDLSGTTKIQIFVKNDVNQLFIYSDNAKTERYVYLEIEARSNDFYLILQDVTLRGIQLNSGTTFAPKYTPLPIISMTVPVKSTLILNLETYGEVTLYGAAGAMGGASAEDTFDGTDGAAAISCLNLYIRYFEALNIIGGNGGNGHANTRYSNGGNGAPAIKATETITVCYSQRIITLMGGNGGNAGGPSGLYRGKAGSGSVPYKGTLVPINNVRVNALNGSAGKA